MLNPNETLTAFLNSMQEKANSPFGVIVLLSIMGGGAIAMGDIFWAHSTVKMSATPGLANFIGGLAFASGLMMVVFYGGHLFTSSVVSGVNACDRRLAFGKTLGYWTAVWVFNFVGSLLVAYMYFYSSLPLKFDGDIAKRFVAIGVEKTSLSFLELFLRAIFCNVFVCMGVFCATASKELVGKFFAILWMVAAFVAASMEHCVANMFIITQALLAKTHYINELGDAQAVANMLKLSLAGLENLNVKNFLYVNLIPVTLGNIVGGFGFVGFVLYYANKISKSK
ncbi:MAG: formate/nitrite transporter family protein [Campylobacter sp.]|nr:formate/nitrite transporter family protein [Campylobacter sp.]